MFDANRRKFLKQAFTAGVFTVACPHILLGKIQPEINEKGDKLTGIYSVHLSEYPVLKELWGSVRMEIIGIDPKWNYPKMIVSKISKEAYGFDYSAVSEACPHEGYAIELLNPETLLFECKKGHGSLYEPNGKYYWGVSKKNLVTYKTEYDNNDVVYVEIEALPTSVNPTDQECVSDIFITKCYPNPASDYITFTYGLENPGYIVINILNMQGQVLENIFSGIQTGTNDITYNTSRLVSGNYIVELIAKGDLRLNRIFQVVH